MKFQGGAAFASAAVGARRLALCLAVAGCATASSGPAVPVDARSLADDFAIVQGLADGVVLSPTATVGVVTVMTRLDRDAAYAVARSESAPGDASARDAAQAAIARLATFAAEMGTGGPAPAQAAAGPS